MAMTGPLIQEGSLPGVVSGAGSKTLLPIEGLYIPLGYWFASATDSPQLHP